MSLIELQDVCYQYPDGFEAVRGVSLKIEKGERVALIGPNGAGKSTLFHLFNGLLKASSGRVYVDGLLVEKKNLYHIRRKVGMVFQDPDDQLFNSTVRQEVAYGPMNMNITGKALDETVREALDAVGMGDYIEKNPYNLSGGEKKKIALASVLAMDPDVLVLDEPTAGLDSRSISNLVELLNRINRNLGITLIFSTHDADIVPLLSDRFYLAAAGEIHISGATSDMASHKRMIRQSGLRLPRVTHLVEILGKDGYPLPEPLPLTIGQARRILKKAMCNRSPENQENQTCLSDRASTEPDPAG